MRGEPRRPPSIAGYVLHTPLGRGAYGEVWLGENRTTKRQVAVKFLHSRNALDWWLLDGETEKLAFLAADRRVVQLLDVGRDADPPFFVMEYVSRGSLARHLEAEGPLPVERAVAIFEELALGLMQVHAKGILHCDLKPSNVLLDDELRPRLADFGQSRLTDEKAPGPALGTMFFMAPEQAVSAAVPDARWDVYALGAVLFTMLEGRPPHQSDEAMTALRAEPDRTRRLARYRQIVTARAPVSTRKHDRPDKALNDIVERCLAVDPRARFATAQEVLGALRRRQQARGRRPMLLLGGLGPLLLLAVAAVFGVRGYRQATAQSADAIRQRAFESNKFAAAFIARSLENEIRRYFDVVTDEARRPVFLAAFRAAMTTPERLRLGALGPDRDRSDPADPVAKLVAAFRAHPQRAALDAYFRERLAAHLGHVREDPKAPRFVSIFAIDAAGTHLGAAYSEPEVRTRSVGRYYAWRSYFHGGAQDLPHATPLDRIRAISGPNLSAPFRSTTTKDWRVGVSVPIPEPDGKTFAGVLVFSVDIGNFDFLTVANQPHADRFAVLVDARPAEGGGRITLHPYFADVAPADLVDRPGEPSAASVRASVRPVIDRETLVRMTRDWRLGYRDPLASAPGGEAFAGVWIAAAQPLALPRAAPLPSGQPARELEGLVVLVQERAGAATGPVNELGRRLVAEGVLAVVAIGLTVAALWFWVLRERVRPERLPARKTPAASPRPLRDRSTLSESGPSHG